jgi:hypothetical protein
MLCLPYWIFLMLDMQQLKIIEIISSVVNSISKLTSLPCHPIWSLEISPSRILIRLYIFMLSFHGGESRVLVNLLYQKIANI